ncbi:stromal cell-derived factor-like protein [Medicago truncatula]|uniref:Stromal cell-derived factor-like protein n=1 Tax=Medicago truncatula TaxID=3880 RepID=A0A072V3I2_MEDTR|nr:stromal cell-derived factor-like protein [Medicago truncatula]
MALGFFALAIFLFLTLDPDVSPSSTASASAASSEGVEVQITYGSVIKLMHEKTKFRLHSHDVPYGSGSGQQSVTGFPSVDDANSYWIVRPEPGTSAKQGDTIKSGTIIRLQHMRTRKWLHSHLHASPISGNLEVCFLFFLLQVFITIYALGFVGDCFL